MDYKQKLFDLQKLLYPREVNIAYDATGGIENSYLNDMDAKRHLIGGALMRRNHPNIAPILINANEGIDYLKDKVGLPTGYDYKMDKHNNEIAKEIAAKQVLDPNTGQKRQMTEQEMVAYIDSLMKETEKNQYYVDGQSPDKKTKYPMWMF